MPDTIRSLAELNAMFADTGDNPVSTQDIRDLVVSTLIHGDIGSGAKAAITIGTGYVPMNLDFHVGSYGVTVDTVNKWITDIPVAMRANVLLEVLFRGANNTTYDFAVFKNPNTTPAQLNSLNATMRLFNASMVGCVSVSAPIDLVPGDVLQAGVKAGASASFELLRARLYMQRIGVF